MKRSLALFLALLALLAALAGCAKKKTGSVPEEEQETTKLGLLLPEAQEGWAAGVVYAARQYCQALAADGQLEYRLVLCRDAQRMLSGVSELKSWGAQAVVACPVWDGLEESFQRLIDGGVKLVSFDVVLNCEDVYRVAGDNEDLGRQCANYVAEKLGGQGRVLLLAPTVPDSAAKYRQKGFEAQLARLAPEMEIQVLNSGFAREEIPQELANLLADRRPIDAVYAMEDQVALGVLQAVKKAGRTDVQVICGGGGCQEILQQMTGEKSLWLQTALYSPAMVEDAVDSALALIRGESLEQVKVIPSASVDRNNAADYLDENCPY